jgi:mannose-6-phosphate isomerase-like protein (cupin superfamily)
MISKRPMISICSRFISREFADSAFSSKLVIKMDGISENDPVDAPADKRDERPWGSYLVLDEGEDYKVKRIEVLPGKRLSYQRHARRSEHWFVARGRAKVTLNDREILVKTGESIDIPVTAKHRVENPGQELLIFIETQTGDYFGEDDIERLDDDFGRS